MIDEQMDARRLPGFVRVVVAVAAMLLVFDVQDARAAGDAEVVARIDQFVEAKLADNGVPGAGLGIVIDDRVVQTRGFGASGRGDARVTAGTPLLIGSVTKSFTALATMQLVEQGRVDLDLAVSRYLTWFRVDPSAESARVTVRMLLNQTSGLPADAGGRAMRFLADRSIRDTAREVLGTRLVSAPGATWQYANINYVLLGALIETVSGEPYDRYLQTHVLTPLGMTRTFLDLATARQAGMASGHRYWFGWTVAHTSYSDGLRPAGGVISTANDMTRYLRMMLGGGALEGQRVLSARGVAELVRPATPAEVGPWAKETDVSYGMGWFVGGSPFGPEPAIFHPGGSPDSAAMLVLLPRQRSGLVLLANATPEVDLPGASGAVDRISAGAVSTLMGVPPAEGWSMHDFYRVFDPLVAVLLGTALWALVRAVRRAPRQAPSRLRAVLRVMRAILALLVGVLVLLYPIASGIGWDVLFLSVPDAALVIFALGCLLALVGGLRLARLARQWRAGPNQKPAISQDPLRLLKGWTR